MTLWQRSLKRSFDIFFALIGIILCGGIILLCWVLATIDTRQNGMFTQLRVGKNGRLFRIMKIRTMRPIEGITTVVTSRNDPRITWLGSWLRRLKLDELPQLFNVLLGHMSFVGPRPDVESFANLLLGEDRIILSIRPGITGPATLAFRDEETLLTKSEDPERYNREVIFPAKTKLNRRYIEEYQFQKDIYYILITLFPGLQERLAAVLHLSPLQK